MAGESSGSGAQAVLADAQFSLRQVIKPFKNFEAQYSGKDARIPVAFPGDVDPLAGQPGYSPYLLEGVDVPFGSIIYLWFPVVTYGTSADSISIVDYTYMLHWRLRTVADYRALRTPYQIQEQDAGQPDTATTPVGGSTARLLLPSALETVLFQQSEPVVPGPAASNLRATSIAVPGEGVATFPGEGLPLLPPGVPAPPVPPAYGQYEQGVADPAIVGQAPQSLFRVYCTRVKGNQLTISARRTTIGGDPNWDFSGVDQGFSNLYGVNAGGPPHAPLPDLGIYLFTGTAP